MNEGRILVGVSVHQVVVTAALSAFVVPISYRIGERLALKYFAWKDSKEQ